MAALAFLACGDKPPLVSAQAVFAAVDDDGRPVVGAAIYLDERLVGHTGADGLLAATLRGPADRQLQLQAVCPADQVSPRALPPLRLAELARRQTPTTPAAQISIPCERQRRTVAIAVRAAIPGEGDGSSPVADLPVVVPGGEGGRTNAQGVAHLVVRAAPHSRLELQLDTRGRAHADLSPASPVIRLEIGDTDELYVLEQLFARRGRPGRGTGEAPVPRLARLTPAP